MLMFTWCQDNHMQFKRQTTWLTCMELCIHFRYQSLSDFSHLFTVEQEAADPHSLGQNISIQGCGCSSISQSITFIVVNTFLQRSLTSRQAVC